MRCSVDTYHYPRACRYTGSYNTILLALPPLADGCSGGKRHAGTIGSALHTNCTALVPPPPPPVSKRQWLTSSDDRARSLCCCVPLMSKNCKQTLLTDFKVSDVWESKLWKSWRRRCCWCCSCGSLAVRSRSSTVAWCVHLYVVLEL